MGHMSEKSTTCLMCVYFCRSFCFPCSCRRLPGQERELVHPEEDETWGPLGRAGTSAGGDGTGLLKHPGAHPAPLSSALCHPPTCSIKSGLRLQLASLLLALHTTERDACGCDKALRGMELNFSHHCHRASLPAPCTPTPAPNPVFCFSLRRPDRTPEHPRTVGRLGPGSSLSWLQSSTHLEPSTTCTLTLLFIVVNKANII